MYFPRRIQGLQAPSGHVMGTGIALSYGDDIDQPRERSWLLGSIRSPSSTSRGWYWPPFSCSRDAQGAATPVPRLPKAPQGTRPPSAPTRAFNPADRGGGDFARGPAHPGGRSGQRGALRALRRLSVRSRIFRRLGGDLRPLFERSSSGRVDFPRRPRGAGL